VGIEMELYPEDIIAGDVVVDVVHINPLSS
jgi:hypothetical protein